MSWTVTLKESLEAAARLAAKEELEAVCSVLIPIGGLPGEEKILLLKRSMTVETHKGQIAFPGGYRESHDESLLHTALREAQEEIGANPKDAKILGALRPLRTRGAVTIVPWVAHFPLPYEFTLNPGEVDRLLYLPLERLLKEGLSSVAIRDGDANVHSVGIELEGELVWGATARMLEELREHFLALPKK